MDCTRRVFLTTASGVAVSARMAASSVQGANNRVRVADHRHRRPRPQPDEPAQADRRRRDRRALRRLRAAPPPGRGDRRPGRAEDGGVPPHPRQPEIDAVLIGAPDHWHKTMTLDAVAAGKDVYVEKPVSHTIEEGAEMVRASRPRSRSCRPAPSSAAGSTHPGQGDRPVGQARPDHVRPDLLVSARAAGSWPAARPAGLDWKHWLGPAPDQPFRPERLYQWRHFWDFGGGCSPI